MNYEEKIMARKSSGTDQLVSARELLKTAKTAAELRAAQAVLFPLELGMSIEQTAKVIVSFRCAGGGTLHVRKATRPEPELATIYQALDLDPLPGGIIKSYV
jgi:hypothetical protein